MKVKKYWISRDIGGCHIEVWKVKPDFDSESGMFMLPSRCKKYIEEYLLAKISCVDFKALFGKELVEGGLCQVSFNMEVYL